MPVDYNLYPTNWHTHIRPAIRARSGDKCEWCGRANRAMVTGAKGQPVKVVLTVAHLDHDLAHNDGMDTGGPALPLEEANLVHLCQRCHLRHDAQERGARRRERREEQVTGQARLF